jgi:hypothetical protein
LNEKAGVRDGTCQHRGVANCGAGAAAASVAGSRIHQLPAENLTGCQDTLLAPEIRYRHHDASVVLYAFDLIG